MRLKSKYKKILILSSLLLISIVLVSLLNFTKSTEIEELENNARVAVNSELTYYLKVSYDGIDRTSYDSRVPTEENVTSRLFSGYIYVEDKIPDGLTFKSFKVSEDGTIGAINSTTGKVCVGTVYNDTKPDEQSNTNYNGLHYDEATRTVSFRVMGLQAGCNLTIGIVTQTPATTDNPATSEIELRKDFYNYATAREENLTVNSNTVHVWMGMEGIDVYDVEYQYAEGTPDNAPELPPTLHYAEGSSVGVATSPHLEGYKFLGWTTSDATITSSAFRMPAKKVTLIGRFEKIDSYKVTYEIEGDFPEGYIVPSEKEYYPGDIVAKDSFEKGTVFNGYRFLGWELSEGNIEINEYNDFEMPESNVKFIGKFELVTYKVEYKFYDDALPPNYEELLPETKEYRPGETVTLEQLDEVEGYTFLGWYKEDNFIMPEEDIIIYGEWAQISFYDLEIEKRVISAATYYKPGDIVKYAIVVSNPNDFDVTSVQVQENKSGAYLTSDTTYTLLADNVAEIPTIPAKGSVTLYAEYKVLNETSKYISNEVEIIGAASSGNNEFNISKEFKASTSFKIYSKLNICKTIENKTSSSYVFHITGEDYDSWVNVGANDCTKIYIPDGEYEISELTPQTDELEGIVLSDSLNGSVNDNGATFTIGDPLENEITFTNVYKKKGFYKSNGEIKNKVLSVCEVFPLTGEIACLDNIKSPNVSSTTGISFSAISSDTNGTGVYILNSTKDDESPIYYYRGEVNNNIIFGNYCWKMVRTTETGGMKLIYNGEVDTGNTCNNIGTASQIGLSPFSNGNTAKYFGYTYDNNGVEKDSVMKSVIDKWYEEHLINDNSNYSKYLEDTVWCNDKSIASESSSAVYYGAYERLYANRVPSLVCPQQADKYTLKSTSANYNENLNGNNLLDYPIALLTADEIVLAGGVLGISNKTFYLYSASGFYTMSPSYVTVDPWGWRLTSDGIMGGGWKIISEEGVRPSISLAPGTLVTPVGNSGKPGTVENPYVAVRRAS